MGDALSNAVLQRLESYQHIIWDWNGTLVDDIDLSVKAVCVLLDEHNLPRVSVAEYREVFGFPIRSYYQKLGFSLGDEIFNTLSRRFHEEYNKHRIEYAKLFRDVEWQLAHLKTTKKQSILSAAAQWHLDDWVKHFQIEHHFDHVFGINDHFASSKIQRGHELLKIANISKEATIMIGDTDHDLEVGHALGIDVLLIADGHQSSAKLMQLHHNVLETRFRA